MEIKDITITVDASAEEPLNYFINDVLEIEQHSIEPHEDYIFAHIYSVEDDVSDIIEKIKIFLKNLPSFGIEITKSSVEIKKLKEEDWLYSWRKFFKPIKVEDKINIRPPWEPVEDGYINLILDPKMGFGTGQHPTTFLCLKALLSESFKNKKVIDVGAGSGILGVAALLLGASWVDFVEKDLAAIESCNETIENNGVNEKSKVYHVDLLKEIPLKNQKFDMAFINIIAEIIIKILDLEFIKNIPVIFLSGILKEKRDLVLQKIKEIDYILDKEISLDEWLFFRITKREEKNG